MLFPEIYCLTAVVPETVHLFILRVYYLTYGQHRGQKRRVWAKSPCRVGSLSGIYIADTQFSSAAAYCRDRLGRDVPRFNDLTLRHRGLEKLKDELHIDFVRHIFGSLR